MQIFSELYELMFVDLPLIDVKYRTGKGGQKIDMNGEVH
jgi:hypothetical protein